MNKAILRALNFMMVQDLGKQPSISWVKCSICPKCGKVYAPLDWR